MNTDQEIMDFVVSTTQRNLKLKEINAELLNAVRFLLSNPDNKISAPDVSAANAAIAKATGEQP